MVVRLQVRSALFCALLVMVLPSCASVGTSQFQGALEAEAAALDGGTPEHQVIVILKQAPPSLWRREAAELAEVFALRVTVAWEVPTMESPCVVYEVPLRESVAEVAEKLQRDHRVVMAQPVNIFRLLQGSYNDTHFGLQHGVQAMMVQEAHRWSTGKGVTIAVVDSGVDTSHPDLEGRVVWSQDLLETAARDPINVHGTAIVGVIAAKANNQEGIVGVAPDAQILALKACWQTVAGTGEAICSTYTLVRALDLAIRARAKVINLSLTGPEDPILTRLLALALDRGTTVVSAVDEGGDTWPGFPASVDGVIAVGTAGMEDSGEREIQSGDHGELVAPGIDILTTVPGPGYDFMSGSSFAAAHTSGVAALILELQPGISPEELGALIHETADRPSEPPASGRTLRTVNACAAVDSMIGAGSCPQTGAIKTITESRSE